MTNHTEHPAHDARAVDGLDLEDDLWRAMALNDLASWIGSAQMFISSVQLVASYDEALKTAMDRHREMLIAPGWDYHHAVGLEALHLDVGAHMGAIRRMAGLEDGPAADADLSGGPSNAH